LAEPERDVREQVEDRPALPGRDEARHPERATRPAQGRGRAAAGAADLLPRRDPLVPVRRRELNRQDAKSAKEETISHLFSSLAHWRLTSERSRAHRRK